MFKVPEKFRVQIPPMTSNPGDPFGLFIVRVRLSGAQQVLKVVAHGQGNWEHVSVSRDDRCPIWAEMCLIKDLFWDDDDVVVQYHPAKKDYVNVHPYCLHLWRPTNQALPVPPKSFV